MINERLRQAREMTGMTIGQAARFSGGKLHRDEIEALEAGARSPSDTELRSLAGLYRVREDWLRGGAGNDVRDALVNARGLDRFDAADIADMMNVLRAQRA